MIDCDESLIKAERKKDLDRLSRTADRLTTIGVIGMVAAAVALAAAAFAWLSKDGWTLPLFVIAGCLFLPGFALTVLGQLLLIRVAILEK